MQETEAFAQAFTEFWKAPTVEGMGELLDPEVMLIQPLSRRMRGRDAALAEFAKIFAWLPDLHAVVDRWSGTSEALFIEFRLRAHVGSELVEWPVLDRFVLRDGRALERVSYFDSAPLLRKVLVHPSSWWGWWKSGAGR